jgi:hypothetical protein
MRFFTLHCHQALQDAPGSCVIPDPAPLSVVSPQISGSLRWRAKVLETTIQVIQACSVLAVTGASPATPQ